MQQSYAGHQWRWETHCCASLLLVLQFFDKDGSGYITIDELQSALKEHGDAASVAAHIKDILADVDKDNDGRIDYEEFCSMMRQGNEEVRALLGSVLCCMDILHGILWQRLWVAEGAGAKMDWGKTAQQGMMRQGLG
jgi:hypothetical protein